MLSEILSYYISEDMARQILKKVPYCLFVALTLYFLLSFRVLTSLTEVLTLISGLSMLVFVVSTFMFLKTFNVKMRNFLALIDYRQLVEKIRLVYENDYSILDEIDSAEDLRLIVLGFLNGLCLSILLMSLLVSLITYFNVQFKIAIIGFFLVLTYLVYDVSKAPIVNEPSTEDKSPFAFDLLERFTITNSMRRLLPKSKRFIYIVGRMIGPLIALDVPKLLFNTTLVYESENLRNYLVKLCNKNEQQDLILEKVEGLGLPDLFAWKDVLHVSDMINKSPRELYPYLLDSASPSKEKGWGAYKIIYARSREAVGYLFVQKFKGVYVRTKIKLGHVKREYETSNAYQFILIGERSYVQYIKNMIEINSAKVPQSILGIYVE